MALLSRVKSPDWQDGDILTAADLKAEFNNIVNGLNGLADIAVISVTATGAYSGTSSSLTGNSSVGGSLSVTGNANAALIHAGAYSPGWVDNLGLALSSGTLSITDASGSALGASNYGWVTVPSTIAGNIVTLKVNAAASIANTATTNLEWGVTSSVDWANDVPFFLYVVNKGNNNVTSTDGNSCFFLAKNPALLTTPSSANSIGDKDAIAATDDQTAIMVLASITEANYTSLPCQLIGVVRMRYATSTHIWSFQTLGSSDGIGRPALDKAFATQWVMPAGQMGAAASNFLTANGGTAPTWSTTQFAYYLDARGHVACEVDLNGDGGTDGSGAVASLLVVPYQAIAYNAGQCITTGQITFGGTPSSPLYILLPTSSGNTVNLVRQDDSAGTLLATRATVNHNQFTNGNRNISAKFSYKML